MTQTINKIDFRKTQADYIQKWTHYDSNINNAIVEQRKILKCKNYELDSRAQGLKDYGFQPQFGSELNKRRQINEIMYD